MLYLNSLKIDVKEKKIMKAFKNTIENKSQALAAARKHRKLDMLIKGAYAQGKGNNFKGCSVGCTYKPFEGKVEASDLHELSEPVHGIPQSLTRLRDQIFEGLSEEDAKDWHVNFIMAINAGADLSGVVDKLVYWLMADKNGIIKYADAATLKVIHKVAEVYKKKINGIQVERRECLSILDEADRCRRSAYGNSYYAAITAYYAVAYYSDNGVSAAAGEKNWVTITNKLISIIKDTK